MKINYSIIFFLASFIIGCENDTIKNYVAKGSGTIEVTDIKISPLYPGRISNLSVNEGDAITKDNLLVTLSANELSSDVVRAELAIETAKENTSQAFLKQNEAVTNFERVKNVYKNGLASKQALDTAETSMNVARHQLSSLKSQEEQVKKAKESLGLRLNEMQIFSPIDGMVLSRNFEIGETVFPGNTIYTIANLKTVYLKIYVPEAALSHIAWQQKAKVKIDSSDNKTFDGLVTYISSEAEFTPKNVQTEDSRTRLVFEVKITIDNPKLILKPGMPADAYLMKP
jgi:HlyD family secretion protein